MAETFEKMALGLMAGLVIAAGGATFLAPPQGGIHAPRASLALAATDDGGGAVNHTRRRLVAARDHTVQTLESLFKDTGYALTNIRANIGANVKNGVPRLLMNRLPGDLASVRHVPRRKALFVQIMLPLILRINEEISGHRRRLWNLRYHLRLGNKIAAIDRLWLAMMAERYGTARHDLDALLLRVDIIPVSLALAQAAQESGWGLSRFAREGNSLFGQWTWKSKGITPSDRDKDKTHRVRSFASLLESVRTYAVNLNTHRAYRELRRERAALRNRGKPLDSLALAGGLGRYSEEGPAYVERIRGMIRANEFDRFDGARFRQPEPLPPPLT